MAIGGLKLLLSYNIRPEGAQEYYQFMLGQYIPSMQARGLEVSEAWHTAYGSYPNRLVGFVSRDVDTMKDVISEDDWADLNEQLLEHVTDFEYKVIVYRQGFQL